MKIKNAEIIIYAATGEHCSNWLVWGESRAEAESEYQSAMRGRWPYKKPLYRVVAKLRKAA